MTITTILAFVAIAGWAGLIAALAWDVCRADRVRRDGIDLGVLIGAAEERQRARRDPAPSMPRNRATVPVEGPLRAANGYGKDSGDSTPDDGAGVGRPGAIPAWLANDGGRP